MHTSTSTDKADANMRALSGGMKRRVLVGAGAGAQAAGDRARRADRRRRRRAAPEPVAVRPRAEPRRPHDRPDHALPRGGRGAVRPHRDAEGRPHRRARHDAQPARRASPALDACASAAARCRDGWPSARCATRRRGVLRSASTTTRELERLLARAARRGRRDRRARAGRADLEEVFLRIMAAARRPTMPAGRRRCRTRDRARRARLARRCSTRSCCASGRSASRPSPRRC